LIDFITGLLVKITRPYHNAGMQVCNQRRYLKLHLLLCGIAAGIPLVAGATGPEGFDHSHSRYAQILNAVVTDDGRVNYASLKDDHQNLIEYLQALASIDPDTYREWTREQQLAYLINLYNAQTLDLVIRHYPIDSIKDIGNLWRGPWGQPVVSLMGKISTLDNLEHKIIRPTFMDPRTHFALVCASRSAPALRQEPYVADRLSEQLADQTRAFLADPTKNVIDLEDNVLHLSSVFKWFADDFEGHSGSIEAFIRPFLHPEKREMMERRIFAIRYLDYDWSLNDR